jgi:hypothetical protein
MAERRSLRFVAAVIMLAGCASQPPAPPPPAIDAAAPALKDTYADLARAGGRVYALDPGASTVRIYAFRAGAAAKLGHNHVLSAPQFEGFVSLPGPGVAGTRFDLQFRLDELEIDRPEQRASLGAAFATPISPEAIAQTRAHLLGDDGLQAGRFPLVRVHALQVSGEAPHCAAHVEIELHGQKREAWLPLAVDGLPDKLAVSGSFVLRQTDFGVKPYAVLGGALAVQDEVVIEFRLIGN